MYNISPANRDSLTPLPPLFPSPPLICIPLVSFYFLIALPSAWGIEKEQPVCLILDFNGISSCISPFKLSWLWFVTYILYGVEGCSIQSCYLVLLHEGMLNLMEDILQLYRQSSGICL